jgi:hypothetical protein
LKEIIEDSLLLRTSPVLNENDENNNFDSALKEIVEYCTLLRTSTALSFEGKPEYFTKEKELQLSRLK